MNVEENLAQSEIPDDLPNAGNFDDAGMEYDGDIKNKQYVIIDSKNLLIFINNSTF